MKIFLSYSWDSDQHKAWIQTLAEDIENSSDSFEVIYDRVGMDHQVDRNFFMEQAVNQSDVMMAIVTKSYTEKANLRQGGVGRETSMAVERHFSEMSHDARSSILAIRREADAELPYYLKPKLYFDFSERQSYSDALADLLGELRAIQAQHRTRSSQQFAGALDQGRDGEGFSFTRTEELIASFYRVREPVLRGDQSREFSSDRKIRYELWRVDTPHPQLLLVLFENINIKQTLEHFFQRFRTLASELRKVRTLTVLRPKHGVSGYVAEILASLGAQFAVTELTFKEYLSTYCVSTETLQLAPPFQEPFYIDQILYRGRTDEAEELGPALRFLGEELSKASVSPLALVVASGGTGKTTLLRALASQVERKGKSKPLLVEVDQLKKLSSDQKRRAHISSVYDLCHLYFQALEPQSDSSVTSGRALFELLMISGSVTILIDGIDEISSLVHENFDAQGFVESVYLLNDELGETRVILASRDDAAAGIVSAIQDRNVPIYSLLGFTESDVRNYTHKRFSKRRREERDRLTARILENVREVAEAHDGFSVVLPFFLDVLCEVEEDSDGLSIFDVIGVNLHDAGYQNNGSLIDLLIFRILQRECVRQSWTLPVSTLVDVFKDIAGAYWGMCSAKNFADTVITFLSGAGGDVVERFAKNPLLRFGDHAFTFKYDFLNAYFSALWLVELLDSRRVSEHGVRHLAGYAQGQGAAFEDLVRYFRNHPAERVLAAAVSCYRTIRMMLDSADRADTKRSEICKLAASATCHLVAASQGHGMNRGALSDHILALPGIEFNSGRGRVKKLFIHGDFPALNFVDVEIWDSEFVGYENFTKSRFDKATFYYSKFTGIKGANRSPSFGEHVFDEATCDIGDLVEVLKPGSSDSDGEQKVRLEEFKRFFKRFFDGGAFRAKRIDELYKFTKIGFDNLVLESLVSKGVLVRSPKSPDELAVTREYRRSVEKFLNEGHLQKSLRQVLRELTA